MDYGVIIAQCSSKEPIQAWRRMMWSSSVGNKVQLRYFIQVQSVAGLLVPIITIKSLIDMDV